MFFKFGVVLVASFMAIDVAHADLSLRQIERSESLAPFIVGGAPADPALWPATLVFDTPARCTATVVGPKALITAAHCLDASNTGSAILAGQTISLTCKVNPSYPNDQTADVAMCATSATITAPGLKYEVLNNEPGLVKVKDSVVLLGFGCTTIGGNVSDVLFVGSAAIKRTPLNFQRYEAEGGAQICEGDSGGAGYRVLSSSKRVVFAVNESRAPHEPLSYLSSVTTPDNMTFIRSWAVSTGNSLCGFDTGVSGCRH